MWLGHYHRCVNTSGFQKFNFKWLFILLKTVSNHFCFNPNPTWCFFSFEIDTSKKKKKKKKKRYESLTSHTPNPWSPLASHTCGTAWLVFPYPCRSTDDDVFGQFSSFYTISFREFWLCLKVHFMMMACYSPANFLVTGSSTFYNDDEGHRICMVVTLIMIERTWKCDPVGMEEITWLHLTLCWRVVMT